LNLKFRILFPTVIYEPFWYSIY